MRHVIFVLALVAAAALPQQAHSQTSRGWCVQLAPTMKHLYSVDMLNRNIGYACGQATIIYTSDGGSKWSEQPISTIHKLYGVDAIDGDCAMIAGRDGEILRTTNSGVTWTTETSKETRVMPLKSTAFVDSLTGWMVGWYGTIIHTTNGGREWVKQSAPTNVFLNKVIAVNKTTAFAVGEHGMILRTTNEGKSWEPLHSGITDSLYGICVGGHDGKHVIAVGDHGTIIHSEDGGATWDCSAHSVSAELLDVAFCDTTHGIAVGTNATILRTDDGGRTWNEQPCPVMTHLNSVSMLTPSIATIVGMNGTILHTTNGGWPGSTN